MSTTKDVAVARSDLERAEQDLNAAKVKVAEADDRLDVALAGRGWRRLVGAFDPGATPLYTSPLFPVATLTRGQVLEHVDMQEALSA